ncbi:MAG: hypothetical protein ACKOA2_00840 [Ilumatobacteraceae bacterium]
MTAFRTSETAPTQEVRPKCDWTTTTVDAARGKPPIDIAVAWFGTWDVIDAKVPELGDAWVSVDDANYRLWLIEEMLAFNQLLVNVTGARAVVWLTLFPNPRSTHPDRVDVYNDLLLTLSQLDPAVRVVDIAGWIDSTGEAARLLPDSVHLTYGKDGGPNSAAEVADRFLTAEILEIFDALPAG